MYVNVLEVNDFFCCFISFNIVCEIYSLLLLVAELQLFILFHSFPLCSVLEWVALLFCFNFEVVRVNA